MAAAGSIVETAQLLFDQVRRPVRWYSLAWTSDASGNVSGIPTVNVISGSIERVVFVPGTGGVEPTDLYDVTLLDSHGIDVLAGQGANLSQSSASHIKPGVPMKDGTTTSTAPIAVDEVLTLAVSAAGNAKSGTVILYVR
jgi:hypothetical protein